MYNTRAAAKIDHRQHVTLGMTPDVVSLERLETLRDEKTLIRYVYSPEPECALVVTVFEEVGTVATI
jgi:hypothetical protein